MIRASRAGFVAGILALTACGGSESPLPLVGTLERDRVEITAEAREIILELHVREGDPVAIGQPLATQDDRLARARLSRSLGERRRAAARVAELERGPRAEDIDEARARLAGARARRTGEEAEYRRIESLEQRQLASAGERDAARARRDSAAAEVAQAAAALESLEQGTTAEELDQARADLERAEADVALNRIALERLTLRATRPGVVDSVPYKAGSRPNAGSVVFVILADTAPYARAFVPQPIRALVVPGHPATITVDGVATAFRGRVRHVAADPVFTPYLALTERDRSRLAYVAEIELLDPSASELPLGLPVEVDLPGLGEDPG
jgi:HlyD family secretion protein